MERPPHTILPLNHRKDDFKNRSMLYIYIYIYKAFTPTQTFKIQLIASHLNAPAKQPTMQANTQPGVHSYFHGRGLQLYVPPQADPRPFLTNRPPRPLYYPCQDASLCRGFTFR